MGNVLTACGGAGLHTVVTYPNSDPGSVAIIAEIETHAKAFKAVGTFPTVVRAFPSLGRTRYLHALKYADALVGNSSSGLYEAPSLRVPVVNVGRRQEGRIKAANVVDAGYGYESISNTIRHYVVADYFRKMRLRETVNPYGDGHAAERILALIERRLGE